MSTRGGEIFQKFINYYKDNCLLGKVNNSTSQRRKPTSVRKITKHPKITHLIIQTNGDITPSTCISRANVFHKEILSSLEST